MAFLFDFKAVGAASGVPGSGDWGCLFGNGLLSAVTPGRIAGLCAARLVIDGTAKTLAH